MAMELERMTTNSIMADDDDEEEEEEEEYNLNLDFDAEMLRFEKEIKDMMLTQQRNSLDINLIDRTRRQTYHVARVDGIQDVTGHNYIKLASLEGSSNSIADNTSKNADDGSDSDGSCMSAVSTENLINYFVAMGGSQNVETSTNALLSYFAMLGKAGNEDDIDMNFVDVLCIHGDINVRDRHGQSLLHETAREWSTGVARFLRLRGANIDAEDMWGRTPLFVAVASSHLEMISWLIKHGADIHHRTIDGEGQQAIHFAARYDAVEAFDLLLKFGADPQVRDTCDRTPFFVAAEAGHARMSSYLLDLELPTASYNLSGVSTIDYVVDNLPATLAWRALDQYVTTSVYNNTVMQLYLSCLGKRRWQLLKPYHLTSFIPPSPLEIIVRRKELSLINHPVMIEMVKSKASKFGNFWINLDLALHLLYTLFWTVCASLRVTEVGNEEIDGNQATSVAVLIISVIAQLGTFAFIYKLYREWKATKHVDKTERTRIAHEVRQTKPFCHPRWRNDMTMLMKKNKAAENTMERFWTTDWVMLEVCCLLVTSLFFVVNVSWYVCSSQLEIGVWIRDVRLLYSAFVVLLVWIRLNRCLRSNYILGPFIAMMEQCIYAFTQIFFLFVEFYVPFTVAFWVLFGGKENNSGNGEYSTLNDLMYQLWLLSFIGDYDYKTLQESNSNQVAEILIGLYLVLVAIITINIYIALLSEAVARVNETASQRSLLAIARMCHKIERQFPEYRREFEIYLNEACAPMTISKLEYLRKYKEASDNPRSLIASVSTDVTSLNSLLKNIEGSGVDTMKKVLELREKMKELKEEYGDEQTNHIIRRITNIVHSHGRTMVKPETSTNNRENMMPSFVKKIIE